MVKVRARLLFFVFLLGEKNMLVDDGVVFHELKLMRCSFGVLSSNIVVSGACIGHEPNQNTFSLCHFGENT